MGVSDARVTNVVTGWDDFLPTRFSMLVVAQGVGSCSGCATLL